MADALRETYKTDFALENMGGVRAPLFAGDITAVDLATMDPFDNTVIIFNISGSRLRNILQSRRPAVSGINYRIENNTVTQATIGGKPLDDNRTYSGVTNSYFARIILRDVRTEDTGRQRRDVLAEYIRLKGTVSPVYDSRRVIR
jgi:2',3'-cyclic-nucleotide 2'-phosphodiesterase (5'-nucleotidase family)